jgi:hypothetical protein
VTLLDDHVTGIVELSSVPPLPVAYADAVEWDREAVV